VFFGGLQKTTLVDYPGKVAATVFTFGCNFRCPYCHNPELVLPELIKKQPKISEEEVLEFLQNRQGLLEGLCITGGEPTMHLDLGNFTHQVKALGFKVKIDSNGSFPERLKKLIDQHLVDYIAMDVKFPLKKYDLVTKGKVPLENIRKSVDLLKQGKVDYEFRTTLVPKILTKEDILQIVEWIKPAPKYFLQRFRGKKTLDPEFSNLRGWPEEEMRSLLKEIKPNFKECALR